VQCDAPSKRFYEGFDRDRPHVGDIRKNRVKRACFKWTVQRDCYRMDRRPFVAQSDVAAFLADHSVAELLQSAN
jgi:hypothetical protein